MNRNYLFTVVSARRPETAMACAACRWLGRKELETIPLSTAARKALRLWNTEHGPLVNS